MKPVSKIYMALIFLFLYAPIFVLIFFSFNASNSTSLFAGFSLRWYESLFQDKATLQALYNSLILAVASSLAATVLGTAAAVGIDTMRNKWLKSSVLSVTNIPMMNPEIVTGISMMLLFVFAGKLLGACQTGRAGADHGDGLVGQAACVQVARSFAGVPHRMERIRELNGITFINDSIASSPSRTIAGLRSFKQQVILIAGGYDKKIPYEPLAPEVLAHVKTLVLMGATGPRIEKAVRECDGFADSGLTILHADSMQHAVELARGAAKPGDVVSLSPASASSAW